MYVCLCIFNVCICIKIYQKMLYAIVRVTQPRSEDSQRQETFFAHPLLRSKPAAVNYDIECLNHLPSQSPKGTAIEP